MFKDTYKQKFDAIQPDPILRQAIEERMSEMQYGNERRRTHTGTSRRMIAVLAAVLALMLAATAYAVVRGNLLRTKLEEQGDETIAAQVRDVHAADAADGFGFTIDEVVWEDDKIFLSYQVSVPDDGNNYLYGIYVPELNGERMDYGTGGYFDEFEWTTSNVYAIGGEFENTVDGLLQELIADAECKERTDNSLYLRVAFFKTDRPIVGVADRDTYIGMTDYAARGGISPKFPDANTLYYVDFSSDVPPSIMLTDYPEVAALFPKQPDVGFGKEQIEIDSAELTMTPEKLTSTGIAEIAAVRELTIPLNPSETQDTIYNDVRERIFDMDGYTIEIADFHMNHFEASCTLFIRKNGEWGETDEPLARSYELLQSNGSELSTEASTVRMSNFAHDPSGEKIWYASNDVRGFIALDGVTELLLTPVIIEANDDKTIRSTEYLLDKAISITPIYNPNRDESVLLNGQRAMDYGGMWFVEP